MKHWLLLCEFGGRAIRYELQNPDGKLIGISEVAITSPKRIRDLAAKHSMNFTKYNAVENNCQKWALALLEKLDKDLYQTAQNPRFVPLEKATFVASLVRTKMLSAASYNSSKSRTKRSGSKSQVEDQAKKKKPKK